MPTRDLIVVGTSAGGVEALQAMVRGLPEDLPAAVVIVIHLSPQSPHLLPDILASLGRMKVANTSDGATIQPGHIYIAPPDHHLLIEGRFIKLSRGPKENRARPAIDPLFRTAAAAYGRRVVGVILTGMLDDGTAGLATVKHHGGVAVVQDPQDALYPGMPRSAVNHVAVDHVLPLQGIAPLLCRLANEEVGSTDAVSASGLENVEARLVEMQEVGLDEMTAMGPPAGVSCPECHGPMWKIVAHTLPRYRCHVGHAYTAQNMVAGQTEAEETHLWQALRLMKERASVLFELNAWAQDDGRGQDAQTHETAMRELQGNITAIRNMIKTGDET